MGTYSSSRLRRSLQVEHRPSSWRPHNTGDQLQRPTQEDGAAAANMIAVPSYKKGRRALSAASPRWATPPLWLVRILTRSARLLWGGCRPPTRPQKLQHAHRE
jgi:hypothetical protein